MRYFGGFKDDAIRRDDKLSLVVEYRFQQFAKIELDIVI